MSTDSSIYITYTAICSMAFFCVWVGSKRSLTSKFGVRLFFFLQKKQLIILLNIDLKSFNHSIFCFFFFFIKS